MNEDQAIKTMEEIEETALNRFLDGTNYNRFEHMTIKEKKEFIKLYKRVYNECVICGKTSVYCECK